MKLLGSPPRLNKLLYQDTLSTLTPRTSTGTDITRSHRMITEFQQISNKERCVVIGNPQLPQRYVRVYALTDVPISNFHQRF